MEVRLLMAAPAIGFWVKIVGGFVSIGGELTTMLTGADVPRLPVDSKAMAVKTLVAKGTLLQTTLYGLLASLASREPLARNWTLVTLPGALAVAVMVRLVGPCMTAPLVGLVICASGVPRLS